MISVLPVYNDEGGFDFKKLMDLLGITEKELTRLLKLSESTIRRNKTTLQTRIKSKNLLYIVSGTSAAGLHKN